MSDQDFWLIIAAISVVGFAVATDAKFGLVIWIIYSFWMAWRSDRQKDAA